MWKSTSSRRPALSLLPLERRDTPSSTLARTDVLPAVILDHYAAPAASAATLGSSTGALLAGNWSPPVTVVIPFDQDWILRVRPGAGLSAAGLQQLLDATGSGATVVRSLRQDGFWLIHTPAAVKPRDLFDQLKEMPGFLYATPDRAGNMPIFDAHVTTTFDLPPVKGAWVLHVNGLAGETLADFEKVLYERFEGAGIARRYYAQATAVRGEFVLTAPPLLTRAEVEAALQGALGDSFAGIEPDYLGNWFTYRGDYEDYHGEHGITADSFMRSEAMLGFDATSPIFDGPPGSDWTVPNWVANAQSLLGPLGLNVKSVTPFRNDDGTLDPTVASLVVVEIPDGMSFEQLSRLALSVPGFQGLAEGDPLAFFEGGESPTGPVPPVKVDWQAVGAEPGTAPVVTLGVDDNNDGRLDRVTDTLTAFEPSFTGGVHVALGDFNGDGVKELVTAADAGGGPHVKIWNVDTAGHVTGLREEFFAFQGDFRGGVNVTAGDLNGDGQDELVCAAGPSGGPHVKVFSDTNGDGRVADGLVDQFFAYSADFRGGVRVAVGQFAAGERFLVAGAGPGGGPHVKVFRNEQSHGFNVGHAAPVQEFFASDAANVRGVNVGTQNIWGDSLDELIVGVGGRVQVFDEGVIDGEARLKLRYWLVNDAPASYVNFNGGVFVGAAPPVLPTHAVTTDGDFGPESLIVLGNGGMF